MLRWHHESTKHGTNSPEKCLSSRHLVCCCNAALRRLFHGRLSSAKDIFFEVPCKLSANRDAGLVQLMDKIAASAGSILIP
jgi:hypothetical protein